MGRHVADDPLSPTTLELAKEWLKECLENHPECQTADRKQLPTRVIHVGPDGEMPRLYITNGERGKYLTLSHCWGKVSPLTTTRSTLTERVDGVAITEMPKTFQDAV